MGQSHFGGGEGALAEEDLYRQGDGQEEGEEDSMADLAELYRRTDAHGQGVGLEGLDMRELLDVGKPLSEFVFAALRYSKRAVNRSQKSPISSHKETY